MFLLLIVDKFLQSVVVWTVLTGYQKRCRTPSPSGDKFSRPDHIFVGLGQQVCREGHTLILTTVYCLTSN